MNLYCEKTHLNFCLSRHATCFLHTIAIKNEKYFITGIRYIYIKNELFCTQVLNYFLVIYGKVL